MNSMDMFVKKALSQDDRNFFEGYSKPVKGVPKEFEPFYKKYNPVDVEIKINRTSVKLIRYEELSNVAKEYDLSKDCFVFATCNGDPIYQKKTGIYSCVFGKNGIVEDKLADSLNQYFEMIDS